MPKFLNDIVTTGKITVGVDDAGHDVQFFGATAGKYMLWDESADALVLPDATPLKIGSGTGAGAEGDLQLKHTGTNSEINNWTGDLYLTQNANNKDIILQSDDGSGGVQTYLTIDGGDETIISSVPFHRKFTVTSTSTHGDVDGDIVYFGSGTVAAGKIYHYKSDGSWEAADANDVTKCDGLLGVALAAGTASSVGMLLRGMVTLIDIQGSEAVGDVLYLSESATGEADCVAPAGNGDIIRIIGYCLNTDDCIWFNPDNTYVEVSA